MCILGFTRSKERRKTTVGDRVTKTLVGTLDETDILIRHSANKEGLVEIPMIPLIVHSDVEVYDVPTLQYTRVRDPVTDHLIDGSRITLQTREYVHTLLGKK